MIEPTSLTDFLARFPRDDEMDVSRVLAWRTGDRTATCLLACDPWWLPYDPATPRDAGRLEVECSGVLDATLRIVSEAEEECHLWESFDAPALWRYGQHAAIYASEPLSEPARYLAELTDVLRFDLRADDDVITSLIRERVSAWATRMTDTRQHHVLTAPAPVAEAAARLLAQHGVTPNLVRLDRSDARVRARLVTIGESWVACEQALVRASLSAT